MKKTHHALVRVETGLVKAIEEALKNISEEYKGAVIDGIKTDYVYPNRMDVYYEVEIRFTVPVDWTKVPIDTKVLCKLNGKWYGRHFAGLYCNHPTVWDSGCTSHSTNDGRTVYEWDEIKLAE